MFWAIIKYRSTAPTIPDNLTFQPSSHWKSPTKTHKPKTNPWGPWPYKPMAKIIHESAGKMTQLCRRIVHVKIKWSVLERMSVFRQFFRFIWDRILACSVGRPGRYRRLSRRNSCPSMEAMELGLEPHDLAFSGYGSDSDSDLVALKISILGDCQIGKTSFVVSLTLCYNHYFSNDSVFL